MNPAMSSPGPDSGPFEKLLRWLSEDPDIAEKKYDEIERKMVRFFVHRGWRDSHKLFILTVDRVMMIIDRGDQYSDPLALFIGVAINIDREERKKPEPEPLGDRDFPSPEPDDDKELHEQKLLCMDQCLDEIPKEDRDLITKYHAGKGRERINVRKQLAKEHGGHNTLRIKAFRIRRGLRTCITNCLKRAVN